MSKTSIHRIAQSLLLMLWVLILVTESSSPVSSQSCGNIPPYYPLVPESARTFWLPNIGDVVVKIDSKFATTMHDSAIWRITAGNELWNNDIPIRTTLTCTNITFVDFGEVTYTQDEYDNPPPYAHVLWQVDNLNSPFAGGVLMELENLGFVQSARIKIKPTFWTGPNDSPEKFAWLGAHEIGHTFGLTDCLVANNCIAGLQMTAMVGDLYQGFGPSVCDVTRVNALYCPPSPTPTATPTPEPTPEWPWPEIPLEPEPCANGGWFWNFTNNQCNQNQQDSVCINHCVPYQPLESGGCNDATDYCAYLNGCPIGTVDGGQGCCCGPTPVLIDVNGDGFKLTAGDKGVMFDMGGDGRKEPVAWTKKNSDDAWLAIDRNGNGVIDSGKELFGSFTDQPNAVNTRNGFVALAEFDRSENGGNGDGLINKQDAAFNNLRLWQDSNKNGISEPSELRTLKQLGLKTIELDFKESKKTDEHGNQFKYRAKVKDSRDAQMGRWAWDVYLKANLNPYSNQIGN